MVNKLDNDPIDRAISRIAERQHGVITIAQLLALGLIARR
jgi:hypothetical protein